MDSKKLSFLKKTLIYLKMFDHAAENLNLLWGQDQDNDVELNMYLSRFYPFNRSFDDLQLDIREWVRDFSKRLAEMQDNTLRNDLTKIISVFINKYGKSLAAHPHIKQVENDILGELSESIAKYLGYEDYRKIWSIIDKFTKNDGLFDDNINGLAEAIIDEWRIQNLN
jgi:hypothetical protein